MPVGKEEKMIPDIIYTRLLEHSVFSGAIKGIYVHVVCTITNGKIFILKQTRSSNDVRC